MKSVDPEAVATASKLILEERLHEQLGSANRLQTFAVYVTSTDTPDDALPAVKTVEAVLKAHTVAAAQFHAAEAARFKAALIELEGAE